MALVNYTVAFIRALERAYHKKWSFLGAFLVVFFLSFLVLAIFDIVPDPIKAKSADSAVALVSQLQNPLSADVGSASVASATIGELPVKVSIPSINLSVSVTNPTTTNVEVLDQGLLTGAVRYPTSATLGKAGNVILFGHSSYLPVVNNQAYKTFDGIQKLAQGDRITVYSNDKAYVYSVDTVTKADANSASIPLTVSGSRLTLATCDSFGTKSSRFIVTASLVESYPITS